MSKCQFGTTVKLHLNPEKDIFINGRSLSSRTLPFMGMFDLYEDLISLRQSPSGNAQTERLLLIIIL